MKTQKSGKIICFVKNLCSRNTKADNIAFAWLFILEQSFKLPQFQCKPVH
jgi:hypothetical protein